MLAKTSLALLALMLPLNAVAAEANDPSRIKELSEQAAKGDWTTRTAAIESLREDHGGHAVGGLLRYAGSRADVDSRVQAVYALRRLGAAAVPALIAALHADDAMIRRNAAMALGAMGDTRARGPLAAIAENDEDPLAREQATEALSNLGGGAGAGGLLVGLARSYRTGGVEAGETVFFWNGSKVGAIDAGATAAGAAYAKLAAEDALRLNPSDEAAQAELLAAYAAMKEAIDAGEGGALEEKAAAINSVLALGGKFVDEGAGDPVTFENVAGAAQLLSSDDKRLRYRAALSLSASDSSSNVVGVLSDALSESAIRQILVVDDDPAEMNRLVAMLRTRVSYAVGATTGAMGLVRAKSSPVKDLVVIDASVSDIALDRFVQNLRRDSRTAGTPVIVLANESDTGRLGALLGDSVQSIVPTPVTLPILQPALDAAYEVAALNDQRMQAEQFSRQAAQALSQLDAGALGPATEALIDSIGREDEVQIPALNALAKTGPAGAQGPASMLFMDSSASTDARVAAAGALSGVLARHTPTSETLMGLHGALAGGDTALKGAAARALGAATLSPADRTALLLDNSVSY